MSPQAGPKSTYAAPGPGHRGLTGSSLQYEFTKSEEFALFLKARFNMWTFDVEDPLYPDHDNYFLTDDQMFLIAIVPFARV